jgi:hypothetical protein
MKQGLLLGFGLAIFATASPFLARAQLPATALSHDLVARSSDIATAAELFRQGRAAFEARDFRTARARLLESARLNPRVGTFISLAECEEAIGLLAVARAHWQQAVDLGAAQADSRVAFARDRLHQIDSRVPRLTLSLPSEAPEGTLVRVDDIALGSASTGIALPAEVGKHVLLVAAPGHVVAHVEIDLAEGERREVRLSLGPPVPIAFMLAVDVEGAVPLYVPHLYYYTLNDGVGFKVRAGEQIRLRRWLRITPEIGYGFEHLFFKDDEYVGYGFQWDLHRVFTGVRLAFGQLVRPAVYTHVGYGWKITADSSLLHQSGYEFDLGGAFDFHFIPHLDIGAHVEFARIARASAIEWLALGGHAAILF